jgi:hypothetical protein
VLNLLNAEPEMKKFTAVKLIPLIAFTHSLSACQKRAYNSPKFSSQPSANNAGFESEYTAEQFAKLDEQSQLHAYARACEKKLGKIPKPDCSKGYEVPVGVTTSQGFQPHGKPSAQYNGSWNEDRTCDRPSFLLSAISSNGSCAPYSKAGRLPSQEGFKTEWVFVCRRYFDRPEESTRFDDVNLIGYDRSSGATCFFNSKVNEEPPVSESLDKAVDVKDVPEVMASESLKFYQTLKLNASEARCVSCHSAQPWLRTPYLQQVKWGDESVVPSMTAADPYHLVAYNYMEAVHTEKWTPKTLVSAEAKACTGCHRIGGDVYASYIAPAAVGFSHGLKGQEDKHFAPKYSERGKAFPSNIHFDFERKLMPLPKSPEDWEKSKFKAAAEFILKCGKENDPTCIWHTGASEKK